MALSSYALITLEEALTALGEFGDVVEPKRTFIEDLINAASEDVEAFLNYKVVSRTYTDEIHSIVCERVVDNFGRAYEVAPTELYLKNFPITAISSIKFDNTALTDITEGATTGLWWSASDLSNAGKIIYESGFPVGTNNVKITYTAGYSAANIPYKIRLFCKEMFLWHYSKMGVGSDSLVNGVKSGTIAPGTGTFRTLEEIYTYFGKSLSMYRRFNG